MKYQDTGYLIWHEILLEILSIGIYSCRNLAAGTHGVRLEDAQGNSIEAKRRRKQLDPYYHSLLSS
jgi:hypothetical protein